MHLDRASDFRITREPLRVGAAAVYEESAMLRKKFTTESRYGDTIELFREVGDKLWLPRAVCPTGGIDDRVDGWSYAFDGAAVPKNSEQLRVIAGAGDLVLAGESFIIEAPTGFGKCLAPNTEIIKYDGSVVRVDTLVPGDYLMGPDSTPRKVLIANRGEGELYRITMKNGTDFVCNGDHIMPLAVTGGARGYGEKGEQLEVTVREWLTWSKYKKHTHKMQKTGIIDFKKNPKLRIDPYFLGVLLGDGSLWGSIGVTTTDVEIENEVRRQAKNYGIRVRVEPAGGKSSTYYLVQSRGNANRCALRLSLEQLELMGTKSGSKFIPKQYKTAPYADRLGILAGLIDTDGYLFSNCFEYSSKSVELATDFSFVARSVGLRVRMMPKIVNEETYYRVIVTGDTDKIPTRLKRKQATPRKQKKNPLVTGFTITPIGVGAYFGIVLDGDHRFLLSDFTITHNTVIGSELIAWRDRSALVVVPKEDIAEQWRESFKMFLNLKDDQIGVWQGDKMPKASQPVVIAMLQSVYKDGRYPKSLYRSFGTVIFDECFHPSTELLTLRGWVPIADVSEQDKVAQVEGETNEISFVRPYDFVEKPFSGELVRFEYEHVDLLATPGHQHLVYWNNEDTPKKVAYGDLVPTNRWSHVLGGTVSGHDALSWWERFQLAFQADGTYLRYACRKKAHHVRFSFRKDRKIDRLVHILGHLKGVRWNVAVNARGDTSIQVWLVERPAKDLGWMPVTKSSSYYQEILEEVVLWDGWVSEGRPFYESTLECNADAIQTVACLAGFVAKKSKRVRPDPNHKDMYRVAWFPKVRRSTRSLRKTRVPYSGPVYCVRVEHGNLLVRRNGKICVTGNCHRLGADEFSKAVWQFPARVRIGLSATTQRQDGKDVVFHAHIGPVMVKSEMVPMIPKVLVIKTGWKRPWREKKDGTKYAIEPIPGRTTWVDRVLAHDPARNKVIVTAIKMMHSKKRNLVVFAETLKHLEALHKRCLNAGVPYADIGMYVGGMSKAELDKSKSKQVVLATYKMGGEGTNVPWWDACILCTPKSEVTQIIGRVLREYPDKKQPVIMDLWDEDSTVFTRYHKRRLACYEGVGAVIKDAIIH